MCFSQWHNYDEMGSIHKVGVMQPHIMTGISKMAYSRVRETIVLGMTLPQFPIEMHMDS